MPVYEEHSSKNRCQMLIAIVYMPVYEEHSAKNRCQVLIAIVYINYGGSMNYGCRTMAIVHKVFILYNWIGGQQFIPGTNIGNLY
jgi:hypothetical protein